MRPAVLAAAVLLAASLTAIAPVAEARDYCTALDAWCPGLYCKYDPSARVWRCVKVPEFDCVHGLCLGP